MGFELPEMGLITVNTLLSMGIGFEADFEYFNRINLQISSSILHVHVGQS